jgi:CBS domain containing-hemolysin-like protein
MEDALEEVVGEIYDEHDDQVITSEFKKISDKTYEVDAKMELTDLFEELEIEHLPETEYTTVGGFLYELAENLPALNQVLEFVIADEQQDEEGDYVIRNVKLIFKITEIEDRRIRKVVLEIEQLTNKI